VLLPNISGVVLPGLLVQHIGLLLFLCFLGGSLSIVSRNIQIYGIVAIYWAIWKLQNKACLDGKLIKSPTALICY
jgi:hypothetical protein